MKWLWTVLVVGGVLVAGLVGWWWANLSAYPFTFTTMRFRLAENWFLGEFQPVFLWRYSEKGKEYFQVVYKDAGGKVTLGQVLVATAELGRLPHLVVGEENPAEAETAEYRYPFILGQRIRVTFLTSTDTTMQDELGKTCEKTPRICQVAAMMTQQEESLISETNQLQYPPMPVAGVMVSTDLVNKVQK